MLAATVTLVALTGCGAGAEETKESSAEETAEATETEQVSEESESAVPSYSQITVGEDYTDLTTSIKWIHHKTDRQEDGTIDKMIGEFNKVYPNITVETEAITDYTQVALLRLSAGDCGDIMFIPNAVDKAELSTYYYPLDSFENMDKEINFAINVDSSDDKKTAAMVFIKWMTEKSGWCYNEGGFMVDKEGQNQKGLYAPALLTGGKSR